MKSLKGLLTGAVLMAAAAMPMTALAAGEIVIAIGSEPSTLDPQARDDGGERAVNDNIYETLMARDADGTLVPGLAAEPPTKIDPTTWEFKLAERHLHQRRAVRRRLGRGQRQPHHRSRLSSPSSSPISARSTGAETVDDLTLRITTTGPDPILPSRMYWMKMVPPDTSADPKFAEAPVGTGPYKFEAATAARTSSSSPIPTTGAARPPSTR